MAGLDGVLVVDKPAGMTSADVVARAKRILGGARVGHTGTLDPMATGVLPIVVGEGTKLAPFLLADDKEYEGELELGVTTTTLDVEGEVVTRAPADGVTEPALREAMAAWVGARKQIPPMYSALKRDGKRLYELARAGVDVERAPRDIRIKRFDLRSFTPPRARFEVACSKGTYVRSLVRDVGEAVGCGATLTALRRTRAGGFTLPQALPLGDLTPARATERIVPIEDAIAHLPTWCLDARTAAHVAHGRKLPAPPGLPAGTPLRLLAPSGHLAAVAEVHGGSLTYHRVFRFELTHP